MSKDRTIDDPAIRIDSETVRIDEAAPSPIHILSPDLITRPGLTFAPNSALNSPGAFSASAFDDDAFDTDEGLLNFLETPTMTRAGLVFTPAMQVG